ncbi:hypothetical protein A5643_09175 [Mycobacterium sp. 1274756.6]|nr:hypothetical protein A5643_09175 [Mycobacterium sp. 1274756.6]
MLAVGAAGAALFAVGLLIAGFVPPPGPMLDAENVAEIYRDRGVTIRLGMLLGMVGCAMTGALGAVLCVQMKRVEGRDSPLAYLQLMCGLVGNMLGALPLAFAAIAAFRIDRDPELYLLFNDTAWLLIMGVFFFNDIQVLAIGVCAFRDSEERVFPRWYAWFSVWIVSMTLPLTVTFFMHDSVFAFDGALGFWFVVVWIVVWFEVTVRVLIGSIRRDDRDHIREDAVFTPSLATGRFPHRPERQP